MGYAEQLFDLADRVVLITGGSRGLGREMAFGAARCGADVVIASRNLDNCVATAQQIEHETGRRAMAYQVHVGRWDQLDGLVEASYDRFGKIDTLINNAGMSPLYDKLTDVTEKLFDAWSTSTSRARSGCRRWSVSAWWPPAAAPSST